MNISVRPPNKIHERKCGELAKFDVETENKNKNAERVEIAEDKEEGKEAKVIADPGQPTRGNRNS